MKIPEDVVMAIHDAECAALFTHIHPDGDALGSLLAFADILKGFGKKVFCYLEEDVPTLYDFLPGCEMISTSLDELHTFCDENEGVIGVSLDCGDCNRLGQNQGKILTISPFLAIDHHQSHRDYAALSWVDPHRSSTGEMIYELASHFGCRLSYAAALNLYVAIVTDTGSFRYSCTSSRTLQIAADLLDCGVRPDDISEHLNNSSSYQRIVLMEMVLASLTMHRENAIALIRLRPEMLVESGAVRQDVEGFVEIPRSIKSVKVVGFLKEQEDGIISVSLRAKGDCDVSVVANRFGGGGHRNASGCRFSGQSLEEAEKDLLAAVAEQLDCEEREGGMPS